MPIYLNSTKVGSNAYDVHSAVSTKLNKIKLNTTQVWTGSVYDVVKNYSGNIPEDLWLQFVNEGDIALARTKGETSSFIGKNVTISNSETPSYNSWKIADFNHDNSGNTCDLIANNTVKDYPAQDMLSYLINTYQGGFSNDIRSKLKKWDYPASVARLLYITEVGLSSSYYNPVGTQYPIFSDNNSRIRTGAINFWWLASRQKNDSTMFGMITSSGGLSNGYYTNSYGYVPVIRFN